MPRSRIQMKKINEVTNYLMEQIDQDELISKKVKNVSSQKKVVIENGTEVTLNLSPNIISDSNDENDFPHNLLSLNTYVL